MTDILRAKLTEILNELYHSQPPFNSDDPNELLDWQDMQVARAKAQIEKAFFDAGRIKLTTTLTTITDNKIDGQKDFEIVGNPLMTGPEWYERFDKNLRSLVSRGDGETWIGWDCGEVREAARRAAGLEDTTE